MIIVFLFDNLILRIIARTLYCINDRMWFIV